MSEGAFPIILMSFPGFAMESKGKTLLLRVILIGSTCCGTESATAGTGTFALAELETVPKCIPDPVPDPDFDPDPT
jgi:hypothetical protein